MSMFLWIQVPSPTPSALPPICTFIGLHSDTWTFFFPNKTIRYDISLCESISACLFCTLRLTRSNPVSFRPQCQLMSILRQTRILSVPVLFFSLAGDGPACWINGSTNNRNFPAVQKSLDRPNHELTHTWPTQISPEHRNVQVNVARR